MLILFLIILALMILLFGTLWIFLREYRTPRRRHSNTPASLHIPFQEMEFPTQNNCHLYGWWIPANNGINEKKPLIILTYGWGQNIEAALPFIEKLHPAGFHLLAFDARSHGSSDSDGYATMLKFAEDIQAAVRFARENYSERISWIGLLGFSIGGAASIYAAAHDPQIYRVVTIGAFAHPASIMKREFQKRHIPYFPVVWLLFRYIQFYIGATFDDIAPQNNIARVAAEIFLIHGEKDHTVPLTEAYRLKEKARTDKSCLWIVPGAGHFTCAQHPDFWKNIIYFFSNGFSSPKKVKDRRSFFPCSTE